jgi:hypothetical protein
MSLEEKIEDLQASKNLDEWMVAWEKKKFPGNKEYTYEQWKDVWKFWYQDTDLYDLPLKIVVKIYDIRNEQRRKIQENSQGDAKPN